VRFADLTLRNEHYRSDWHRLNLKRRSDGRPPLSEAEFDHIAENGSDVESLSASDGDDDDDDDDDDDKSGDGVEGANSAAAAGSSSSSREGAFITFTVAEKTKADIPTAAPREEPNASPLPSSSQVSAPPSTNNTTGDISDRLCFSVYKEVLGVTSRSTPEECSAALAGLETTRSRPWAVLMLRSGHFAGAIFEPQNPLNNKGKHNNHTVNNQQSALCHRTFHRYTTRKKAGGAQSAADARQGGHKSAGANLRRYGEQMLTQDIQALLASSEWCGHLANCT
jgi:hypothetical protein